MRQQRSLSSWGWSHSHADPFITGFMRRVRNVDELPLGAEDYVNPGVAMNLTQIGLASNAELIRRLRYMAKSAGLGQPPSQQEILDINNELARRRRADRGGS